MAAAVGSFEGDPKAAAAEFFGDLEVVAVLEMRRPGLRAKLRAGCEGWFLPAAGCSTRALVRRRLLEGLCFAGEPEGCDGGNACAEMLLWRTSG